MAEAGKGCATGARAHKYKYLLKMHMAGWPLLKQKDQSGLLKMPNNHLISCERDGDFYRYRLPVADEFLCYLCRGKKAVRHQKKAAAVVPQQSLSMA